MVLVCNHRADAVQVAEALATYQNPVAHTRIARMHGRHSPDWNTLHQDPRWEQAVAAVKGYEESPELELES
jgi:beta-N-acetylhexosaminidase